MDFRSIRTKTGLQPAACGADKTGRASGDAKPQTRLGGAVSATAMTQGPARDGKADRENLRPTAATNTALTMLVYPLAGCEPPT
jgi:hypothetical protein